ncbi:hypothetical protein HMN09_01359800 [Mycena chlorophos]|uniref:Uncharacterized protein n=1 Tax=Mycena chlorophos TaxID=658473 RepID=A0A8H6RY64_MYCCL|nr:hypothetical protein HMN09_01359800 [Mycena chlorophos]
MHSRARSQSQAHGPPPPPSHIRTHRRRRTVSVVSTRSSDTTSKLVLPVQSSSTITKASRSALGQGSFTLTGCARDALLEVAFSFPRFDSDDYDDASEEDSDSAPPSPTTRTRDSSAVGQRTSFRPRRSDSGTDSDASIPSISRTASTFQERPPMPPGWGPGGHVWRSSRPLVLPGTSRSRAATLPLVLAKPPSPSQNRHPGIHAVLDGLEQTSRINTGRVACAACTKTGVNFPRCRHCGQLWCCRECRTSSLHRCTKSNVHGV